MSYALAASYSFILLITLTPSKALDITVLSTYLKDLLLRQLEILVDQALVLVGLVAHAACGNRADLNPLPPQRRGSLVARQCRRRRNAAQQIRRVQRPS
ncbi:hypothetical protein HBH51_257890 [Parastagonospora nodorum]|nr:hypothetical protein HBH51_257890 [Parastagonospora nodorum]